MELEYSWDAILALHDRFSQSQISIEYLRKIWNSNIDSNSVYLPDCFSLYKEITGISFDHSILFDPKRSFTIKYLFLRALFLKDIFAVRDLSNLEIIDCEVKNSVDSLVPLENLIKLQKLYFSGNKINNLKPLAKLRNLELLDLSDNRLTYIGELYGLTNLKELYLDVNKISDINCLSNLASLEVLNIQHNQINDVTSLNKLKQLKVLYLAYNPLSVEKVIELGKQIRSCKIYFSSPSFEDGYLLIKEIEHKEVPFFITYNCNSSVDHCCVSLLDESFKLKRNIIDEMKDICRDIVCVSNRENHVVRDVKREHFFYESSDFVRAQFDY